MTATNHRSAIPELNWPEDPDVYVRCADSYSRTMRFRLPAPPRAGRSRREVVRVLCAAACGAMLSVVGLSLGHAYEVHRQATVTVPASTAPSSIPPGVPVIYPTDLGGLLNAHPDQACAPGPQSSIAPCDRP